MFFMNRTLSPPPNSFTFQLSGMCPHLFSHPTHATHLCFTEWTLDILLVLGVVLAGLRHPTSALQAVRILSIAEHLKILQEFFPFLEFTVQKCLPLSNAMDINGLQVIWCHISCLFICLFVSGPVAYGQVVERELLLRIFYVVYGAISIR